MGMRGRGGPARAAGTTNGGFSGFASGYHPVWFRLARGGAEVLAGGYCIIQQFNTTRDTIYWLLQAGTQVPSNLTAQQTLDIVNGNAGKLNSIAFTVALITQLVFWWVAIPAARNGYTNRVKIAIAGLLFILEEISDAQWAASSNAIINGDLTRVFNTGGWAPLGIALFMLCVGFGSTFVFLNGIHVIGNVISGEPD